MPNVILTHTFNIKEIDKKSILINAWVYIRLGYTKKESFKKAWESYTKMTISFWTNAKPEDIKWTIKSCQIDGVVRKDLLRKWDADKRQHPLDWVSYHLRRNGFLIDNNIKNNIYTLTFEIPKM